MQTTKALTTLGRNDARLIGRDSFLLSILAYIVVAAVALRFALPWLNDMVAASDSLEIDVPTYYPLLVGYIVFFIGAVITGMIVGFILLDERDNNTLTALLVTPLPMTQYLAYRVIVPMALSFVIMLGEFYIINQALLPLSTGVILAAGASLTAPLVALFLATFSENKVQGFASLKVVSVSGLLLFAAWFIAPPMQFLFGLFPPYWAVKAYWTALSGGGEWLLYLLVGVVYSTGVILYLVRRFQRMAYTV